MKIRKAWMAVACILAVSLLTACGEEDAAGNSETVFLEDFNPNGLRYSSETLQAVSPLDPTAAHLTFAFDDFQNHTPYEENTLSAPFDLQQLYAMTALGAASTTLDAFNAATGFQLDQASTYAGLSLWDQAVSGLDGVEHQSYLWGQQHYRFAQDYLQAQGGLYGPTMSAMDFLTSWYAIQPDIETTLGGALSLTEIGDRTRLVIAQTTRVEAPWPTNMTVESVSARFGPHEAQQWVDMLRLSGQFNAVQETDYEAVEIPFNRDLSMLMIIPIEGKFDTVRDGLDPAFWQDLQGKLSSTNMMVYVPKFFLEREVDEDSLPDLGVALTDGVPDIETNNPFTITIDESKGSSIPSGPEDPDKAANFTPVNHAGFLFLETPRQYISFSIQASGLSASTAAAAMHTATDYEPMYLFNPPSGGGGGVIIITPNTETPCFYPPEQRPFLFAIYANDSNTLLYLGQVRELAGSEVAADWTVPLYSDCGDSPPVEIYKYTGNLQCIGGGISLEEMRLTLTDAGIEVTDAYQTYDGLAYPQACGSEDGSINVYTIQESQVPLAESLGFKQLTELNL